ncbi:MAG: LTA synthase family protein [Chitinophagaceae bacterium]
MSFLYHLQRQNNRFKPVYYLLLIFLLLSFITRIGLLIYSSKSVDLDLKTLLGIFSIGLFYDICIALFLSIPFILHIWFTGERIYKNPWRWVVIGLYLTAISLLLFTNIIPKEFSRALVLILLGLLCFRFSIYLLLLFTGQTFRIRWRKVILLLGFFIVAFILCFNVVSEFFFWDEFGSRYNFIAVDYLVYTSEVIGNIKESYPVVWIVIIVMFIAILCWWPFRRKIAKSVDAPSSFKYRSLIACLILVLPILVYFFINERLKNFSKNTYANELAGNGIYEFGTAFFKNELDFYQFYETLPDKEAFNIMRKELETPGSRFLSNDIYNLDRMISYAEPEKKYNIVLISMESLSASFMKKFGSTIDITPQLDSLADKGILFTKLYASGNRTVRGLEALSLSIPPLPGQSIVKRQNNENLFSIGAVLKEHNYNTSYMYGGYSYFDNMKYFFENNGYSVFDRNSIDASTVDFANIWGVADEYLFNYTLTQLDKNYKTGQPFFAQIMTVSNHRPYTYPKGRIDYNPDDQSREGAVKYTDYSIGKFIKDASVKPWFKNTIFVIVSDHCANAAGKVELPVNGYHIPMIMYAPDILIPKKFERLTAQIDIVPTILGLLKLSYKSKFYGRDIFNYPEGKDRALISTYQGLGYLTNNDLVVQMPPKKVNQYKIDLKSGQSIDVKVNDSLVKIAKAYYQTMGWIIKKNKYRFPIMEQK